MVSMMILPDSTDFLFRFNRLQAKSKNYKKTHLIELQEKVSGWKFDIFLLFEEKDLFGLFQAFTCTAKCGIFIKAGFRKFFSFTLDNSIGLYILVLLITANLKSL